MATTTAIPKARISGGGFLLESRRTDEVFTPEDFTEQHQLIGQTAEEFTVNEILPNVEKIEHKDFSISRELLKKAGELGLSGVEFPEAYGGLEMDKVTAAVIADHIAKYAGFRDNVGRAQRHRLAAHRVFRHGGAEEESICRGWPPARLWAHTHLSEASSGSDAMNCRTRAQLSADGRHYILNGEKMWITNAGFADLFTVFAKVDDKFSARSWWKNFPRLSIGGEEHKMGIRGSSTCPIILNDCKVPVENLLGDIGKGHVIAFNILNIGRFKLGAMCVGGGRVSLENAIAMPSSARRSARSSPTLAWCARRSPTWQRCSTWANRWSIARWA
jgi:alkylation response protein AidB-like acyl-CoA dehydrogenase